MENLELKYYEQFIAFERGYITEDELYLNIYLGEGLIGKEEYDMWVEKLNFPNMIDKKYKALIKHYKRGNCTFGELVQAIEILEKYNKN